MVAARSYMVAASFKAGVPHFLIGEAMALLQHTADYSKAQSPILPSYRKGF